VAAAHNEKNTQRDLAKYTGHKFLNFLKLAVYSSLLEVHAAN
jgi:hypothetical protein